MTISKINNKPKAAYYGSGPFQVLKHCSRCWLPDTQEGSSFDEMGMCPPCQSSEQKMHINWQERRKIFEKLLEKARSKAAKRSTYDVMVPISGGKDSCFQLHILKKMYNMNVLATTFSHNWYTETGKENLRNILEKLNIDHIMLTPNSASIAKIARESLYQIGDSCWHCHSGVGAFPLQMAVKFRIPLVVWGESLSESDGRATYAKPVQFDRDYFTKISAKKTPEEMMTARSGLRREDMLPYQNPTHQEMKKAGVEGIHLGDYFFWDEMRQVEFVKKEYGWKEDYVEGTYKGYKSVECRMAGVHDYAKFIKRGFGRTTDQASEDVRQGLMTKDEAKKLIANLDGERPDALDYYLKITGFTEKEFHEILEGMREGSAKNLPKFKEAPKS